VGGKAIYYWIGQEDKQIPDGAGFVGIVNSTNITVRDLVLTNNAQGILFAYTNNSRIENVTASVNDYGIYLQSSSNNTLQKNTMSENRYNFGVCGDHLSHYTQDIDKSNTVDGEPIYYWIGRENEQIPCDAGFVGVVNSINITVRDLILTNNTQGVLFAYTNNSRIENVTASVNDYGIYLHSSSNDTMQNNTANSNDECGIYLDYSNNNTLTDNIANLNNECGVRLWHSSNNVLKDNIVNSNSRYHYHYIQLCHCGYGIYVYSSDNNTLQSNRASNNGHGIYLRYSNSNVLNGNIVDSNIYCCYYYWEWYYHGCGIYLYSSDDNTLQSNRASNNRYGIYLRHSSSNNTFYHNNLIDNRRYNANDWSGVNQWDNGAEGNYYSDYVGTDSDDNGIGDTPYHQCVGRGIDHFPLMQPWTGATSQKGDLNDDDQITPADAAIALGMAVRGEWDADADVSGDGRVTSLDALMILQAAAKDSRPDRTPPEITLVNDSIGVNDDIVVSFSEPIDIPTLSISVLGPYGGVVSRYTITCDEDGQGALFDPDNPLQVGAHPVRVKCRDPSDNLAERDIVLMVADVCDPDPDPSPTSTPAPTPTATPTPSSAPKIVINELMPNPIGDDTGNETTELYNCGDEAVNIGGWIIRNQGKGTYTIPAGTVIESHGYYLTKELQLRNKDGQVFLYYDGEEVDRSINYAKSVEGKSWQRLTDGLDTDSDGDWIKREETFGVSG
jgi:parallel beta-helix repeat protein